MKSAAKYPPYVMMSLSVSYMASLPSDDKRLQLTSAVRVMALITSEDIMRSFGRTSKIKCALVRYYCWPSNAHLLVVVRPKLRIIAT